MRIWLISVSFVLFQFFLQLSSGVVIGAIMHDMQLTALTAGTLSAAFYVVYTSLQTPVGILFDRESPRLLLTATTLLCSLGCFIFAGSHTLAGLFIGRTLMGVGSAFAFVGLSHLLRQQFPARQFAFMIGLSETIGFLVTVLGMIGMGTFITLWGWRGFINGAGIVGLTISCLAWAYIPDEARRKDVVPHYGQQIPAILGNKSLWVNGLYIGLTFTIVTVFGAMWASSFLQIKLGCGPRGASLVNALFFLGTGFSCPLFGWLSTQLKRRKPMMFASSLLTTGIFLIILYFPTHSQPLMGTFMFLMGLCCGAYILAFPIANELSPSDSLSTCTGFINTLALITTPILQPFIGYLLDLFSPTDTAYTLSNYQNALLIMPMLLLVACFLVNYLPEKRERSA
ncbi:MAG TPA: MFS transporter [Legionella sp.]|nr:MFS transporter [Legionella sp.]